MRRGSPQGSRFLDRIRHPRWHPETLTCAFRRHVTPAAEVARLRPEDAGVGMELPDGRRMARCVRCDAWIEVPRPADPAAETLPPLAEIALPRRGEPLRELIVLRVIALDRAIHAVLFGMLFLVAMAVRFDVLSLRSEAQAILEALETTAENSRAGATSGVISSVLERVAGLHNGTIALVAATAFAFLVVESLEAVGLWLERRWAEYLTAVATAGFLPLEIFELGRRITFFRIAALVVNVAVLWWLVYRKRLFGVNGGAKTLERSAPDPAVLLAPPSSRPASIAASMTPPEQEAL